MKIEVDHRLFEALCNIQFAAKELDATWDHPQNHDELVLRNRLEEFSVIEQKVYDEEHKK